MLYLQRFLLMLKTLLMPVAYLLQHLNDLYQVIKRRSRLRLLSCRHSHHRSVMHICSVVSYVYQKEPKKECLCFRIWPEFLIIVRYILGINTEM